MQELADAAGEITQATVSNLERGTRNPSRNMAEQLARALLPEDSEPEFAHEFVRRGIRAAGFVPTEERIDPAFDPLLDEVRIASYRGVPSKEEIEDLVALLKMKRERRERENKGT